MREVEPMSRDRRNEVVLFNVSDDYFFDVTLRLWERGGPVRAIVAMNARRFEGRLPGVELIDARELADPEVVFALNDEDAGCLSAADIGRFENVESLYLRITDRLSYRPVSVRFRLQLFRALLRYWLRFFAERAEIGVAFFVSVPHLGADLIAYHVARAVGVRTLFVERSLIANRVLVLEDYSAIDRVPPTFLAGKTLAEVRQQVDPAVLRAVHEASPWSRHATNINERIVADRGIARATEVLAQVATLRLPEKVVRAARRLQQPVIESTFFLNDHGTRGYRREMLRAGYRRHIAHLRTQYEVLATPPSDEPYVLFALHMQPERSTCPQGGVYDDQGLAIETAAKALPAGYTLYVKEHPRQFSPTRLKGRHYRDVGFYRRLAKLPNVRWMSIGADTAALVRGALATVTTTGSAGWESLLAGKPCLAFGTPWYGGCRSCHVVRSLDDSRVAYSACLDSTPAQVERDLLAFLAYVQDRFVYASSGAVFVRDAPDYDQLVDNLAAALVQRIGSPSAAPEPTLLTP
jgi:hypothetical protein